MAQHTPKRLFITGGSGFVGTQVTTQAVAQGYRVHALSRNEASDEKLKALGAVPVRGDLTSVDLLRHEASQADAVITLATAYVFGAGKSFDEAFPTDAAALEAMAAGLASSASGGGAGATRGMVFTSGTLASEPDPSGAETDESTPMSKSPINTRGKAETHALALAQKVAPSVRLSVVRLAPFVYGRGGSGVGMLVGGAVKAGAAITVDGGNNRTTVVHVDDAAALYLLAAQKASAGAVYNASASTDLTIAQIVAAVAEIVGVPPRDLPLAEAQKTLGEMFAFFLTLENRASGAKAVKELGWRPTGPGVLEDIRTGSYREVAEKLKQQKQA